MEYASQKGDIKNNGRNGDSIHRTFVHTGDNSVYNSYNSAIGKRGDWKVKTLAKSRKELEKIAEALGVYDRLGIVGRTFVGS